MPKPKDKNFKLAKVEVYSLFEICSMKMMSKVSGSELVNFKFVKSGLVKTDLIDWYEVVYKNLFVSLKIRISEHEQSWDLAVSIVKIPYENELDYFSLGRHFNKDYSNYFLSVSVENMEDSLKKIFELLSKKEIKPLFFGQKWIQQDIGRI